MTHHLHGIVLVVAFLGTLGWLEPVTLAAQAERRIVRVGIYDIKPAVCLDGNNGVTGIGSKLLREIGRSEGWTVEFVSCSQAGIREGLVNDRLDLGMCAGIEGRSSGGTVHSEEPLLASWGNIYALEPNQYESILDLRGKSVALIHGCFINPHVRKQLKDFNIACDFVEFKNESELLHALREEWVDAAILDRLRADLLSEDAQKLRAPALVCPVSVHLAARADAGGRQLVSAIDYQLRRLKERPNSSYNQLVGSVIGDADDSKLARYLVYSLGVGGLCILLFGLLSLALRLQVNYKTRELREKNHELEEEAFKRQRAQNALKESHRLLEKTFSSINDALLICLGKNAEMVITCNRAAQEIFQYPEQELLKLRTRAFHKDENSYLGFINMLESYRLDGNFHRSLACELPMKRRDGSEFAAEVMANPIFEDNLHEYSWVLVIRDITERVEANRSLEESDKRLRQAQKMEAIGTLAGGIAHDFNNTLTPIMGFAEITRADLADDDEKAGNLDQIIKAAHRAKGLIRQILEFSRKSDKGLIKLDLKSIVKEVCNLMRATLPATIQTSMQLHIMDVLVVADPTQMHQLLMNLCTNAAHAMANRGGVLTISLTDVKDETVPGWSQTKVLPANRDYICLSVSDNGHGIPETIIERIFDPFFTTKRPGEGTGMGLSVVHGIVESHGGVLSVETQLDRGTTFHIYLPRASQMEKHIVARVGSEARGNAERILFVDDDPMVTAAASTMLKAIGYRVVTRNRSLEALAILQRDPLSYDLLITDQTMPQMTGVELVKEVRERCPKLPIIMVTGYSDRVSPESAREVGVDEFIMKPFSRIQLIDAIRGVLDPKGDQRAGSAA